jgi:hypothetical protein
MEQKQQPSAEIYVADGVGGMRPVNDLRFDTGSWSIQLAISPKDAESWFAHLYAEINERGWQSSGISQLDATENSGSLSVYKAAERALDIVWEKARSKKLVVRVRPADDLPSTLRLTEEFIASVKERHRVNKQARAHRRSILSYYGLPWRGELWLDDELRLGPPSKYPTALLGPQALIVDAMVEGIGNRGIHENFSKLLKNVRIFAATIIDVQLAQPKSEQQWVTETDETGHISHCKLAQIGYHEASSNLGFPMKGSAKPVERRDVQRPGLGPVGIWSDMHERWVPSDVESLWQSFKALKPEKQDQFLRAGNAYMTAYSMSPEQRTAYGAFLVVACETLKPSGRRFARLNIYDVVASLLGESEATALRKLTLHPQKVRSEHFHRGKLLAGELMPIVIFDAFADPSFDEMLGHLYRVTRLCLIEWLRVGGSYRIVRFPRGKPGLVSRATTFIRRFARSLQVGDA